MTIESDPLSVLLNVKSGMETTLSDDLVRACYQLQSAHQHDKDRNTIEKMRAMVEEAIVSHQKDILS